MFSTASLPAIWLLDGRNRLKCNARRVSNSPIPPRRKRLCCADLRDYLVSVASIRHWFIRGVSRTAVGVLYGRVVLGQRGVTSACISRAESFARLRVLGGWDRRFRDH